MSAAPVWPEDDEMLTTRPHFASSMSGSTDWMQWNEPVRLTAMMRSHSAVSMSTKRVNASMPAELTSTSTGPSSARVRATAASIWARSDTSTAHPIARPPLAAMPAAARSAASPSRSRTDTCRPSRASRSLMASPMPDAPPVTIATVTGSPPFSQVLPAFLPVRTRRLAPGAHRRQRRVDEQEAVPPLRQLVRARAPGREGTAATFGELGFGPLLPARDGPEQEALALVHHRGLPGAGERPSDRLVRLHRLVGDDLEEVARRALGDPDLLVGVGLAPYPRRAQLGDRRRPGRGDEHAVVAVPAVVGGLGPPLGQLGVLEARVVELVAERRGQSGEPVLFPQVHDLGPAPGGPHDTPHAVAELVAVLLGHRAEVGGHVVHVVGPVVPDDVDELVDVDLLIGGVVHERRAYGAPASRRRTSQEGEEVTGMGGRFEGKAVIVTGAGGGIGREHARLFASEGARVLVNDTGRRTGADAASVVGEIEAAGGRAVADTTSATWDGADAIVQHALDAFGRL